MTKHAAAIVLALALAAGLTACEPTAPSPSPTASSSPSPTTSATPEVDPITAPEPALDLGCTDLVSSATLAGLFTSGVAEVDPERTIIEAANLIPYKYAVEQQGGIACEWSNGQPQSPKVGTNSLYRGTSVTIARVTPTEWARFSDYYGLVGDRQVYCYSSCGANLLVDGEWWVEVDLQGADAADPLTAFTAEVAAIEAAITGAAASGASWTAPVGTITLPADCEAILPAASVQAAFALPAALVAVPPAGGVSLDGIVRIQIDALWCSYLLVDADLGPGTLHRLPGGEWAWNEARSFGLLGGTPVEIDVAGLLDGDSAWVRCPESGACAVDVIVAHNWVQFVAYLDDFPSSADRQVAIEQIATAIVASVRA